MTAPLSIAEVEAATDRVIAAPDAVLLNDPSALAGELLAMGEAVLLAWHHAKGAEPTREKVEGFRLLALHRQGARGNPGFNACRETCRELVYHRNLVLADPRGAQTARLLRLQAMVARHLALFVGGKLHEDGLGDFCCSSRPIRQDDAALAVQANSLPAE